MMRGTTILTVRNEDKVAMAGDGQVTLGSAIIKHTANKVRRMHHGRILGGFAGATADAFALFAKFEEKLEKYQGNLARSAVELAKDWRTDKVLRRLEAMLVVADKKETFLLSGTGDVIEPDDGIIGIGSGGMYAYAAAKAMMLHTDIEPRRIVAEAMQIAHTICIYTNAHIVIEEL